MLYFEYLERYGVIELNIELFLSELKRKRISFSSVAKELSVSEYEFIGMLLKPDLFTNISVRKVASFVGLDKDTVRAIFFA